MGTAHSSAAAQADKSARADLASIAETRGSRDQELSLCLARKREDSRTLSMAQTGD